MGVVVQGPFVEKAEVCEPILRALPEWFGIEEATRQYIADIEEQDVIPLPDSHIVFTLREPLVVPSGGSVDYARNELAERLDLVEYGATQLYDEGTR